MGTVGTPLLFCYRNICFPMLFYSILFYSILFYSILLYYILFYSILFYSILFYSTKLLVEEEGVLYSFKGFLTSLMALRGRAGGGRHPANLR